MKSSAEIPGRETLKFSQAARPGTQGFWQKPKVQLGNKPTCDERPAKRGVTLIELLCVIVIIGILAAMLLPVVARVYRRAKAMSEEVEESEVAERLRHEVRNYCAAHPPYQFDSKTDFADKCVLAPKCREWIDASATVFVPFNHLDPTNKVVVSFHYGRKYSYTDNFTKGDLTLPR